MKQNQSIDGGRLTNFSADFLKIYSILKKEVLIKVS